MTPHLALALGLLAGLWTGAAVSDCTPVADVSRFYGTGWGLTPGNQRFQDASNTRIDAGNVSRLELAWTFALDQGLSPHAFPAVTPDTVFIGTDSGGVYALERVSGCQRWHFQADADVRTALVSGSVATPGGPLMALFFGTREGSVYALDAANGTLLWQMEADPHPFAVVTGSPAYHDGTLYVPVSSYEVLVAVAPFYECCTFRGSVLALDAATGKVRWRTYTVADQPAVTGSYWFVFDRHGPSGAPVWSAPTVDAARALVYVGTGENYSDPATDTSDAVLALDMTTGAIRWKRQFLAGDAWNAACELPIGSPNCPAEPGPDFDFGAPPLLVRTTLGAEVLVAGQKSGAVFAVNPDSGELVWQTHIGRGGKLGGIHWGMAANPALGMLFVPVSDRGGDAARAPAPGLHALSVDTGQPHWQVVHTMTDGSGSSGDSACGDRDGCYPGVSAAVTATADLVFAATLSGALQAFSATSGEALWRFDTWGEFPAVNADHATGAAVDVHGPMVADDMLFLSSGYETFGQAGGNAFLAFKLRDD